MRRIIIAGVSTIVLGAIPMSVLGQGTPSQPAATAPGTPLTLQRLEQLALEQNPTLKQAQAQIDAARSRARQAGAWPNPTIGYAAQEVSTGEVIRGGEHGVFVEQTIPLGGKLRLSGDVFRAEATEAEALANAQRQRVLTTVRVMFYQMLAAERRVDVNQQLAQLFAEAVSISQQLFNVGAADRPDVLESEVEARRARLQLDAAKNRRYAVWRQLAAVIADPQMPLQRLAGTVDSAIPELERDAAWKDVLTRSPELAAARAGVDRSRAIVSRTSRETFPDLFLRGGAAYNRELLETTGAGARRPVGWEASFEAGFSVPLFNRNRSGVAAARADQGRAELEVRRMELALESRFAAAFEQYLTALRGAETYRTEILPRAEEAYRLYLTKYREMAAAYPQVLIAQRSLLQLSDEYLGTLDDAWRAALEVQGLLIADGLAAPSGVGGA